MFTLVLPDDTFYSFPRPLPTQPTLPLSVYLPAVTHVLTFQNAWKVTSHRCVPGRVDSAKKNQVYYLGRVKKWDFGNTLVKYATLSKYKQGEVASSPATFINRV